MGALKNETIQSSDLLKKIKSYDVDEADLIKEFHISEPTIRAYKKPSKKLNKRNSEPKNKLYALELTLNMIRCMGYEKSFETLKGLSFDGMPVIEYINKHASNPLLDKLLKLLIEKELDNRNTKKAIDLYREKYEFLNDETLKVATDRDPELLVEMIEDKDLRPSTRGDILEALSFGARDEYFDYIEKQTGSPAPHVREAAYSGLFEYYESDEKYNELKNFFQESLSSEKADGVKRSITDLIKEM